jgi:hypothetical protein
VTCSNHVESCNRTVTLPTSSCGLTSVTYLFSFCNNEKLSFNFQEGICNYTNAGYNGRSGNCSFACLDGNFNIPMNFASPMPPKTCRSLNYTASINTCVPTPSQIQVQGRLSNQTYCRSYIFLRVNWVPADPPKKTLKPSSKPIAQPTTKPIAQPTTKPMARPSTKPNVSPPINGSIPKGKPTYAPKVKPTSSKGGA